MGQLRKPLPSRGCGRCFVQLRSPSQVHCVRAFGALLAAVQGAAPFPAGLVLHSWGGSADVTHQLARLPGVHFSVSGHATRLKPDKAAAMLAEASCSPLASLCVSDESRAAWLIASVECSFHVFELRLYCCRVLALRCAEPLRAASYYVII